MKGKQQRMQQHEIKSVNGLAAYIHQYILCFGQPPLAIGLLPESYSAVLREVRALLPADVKENEPEPDEFYFKGVMVVPVNPAHGSMPVNPLLKG